MMSICFRPTTLKLKIFLHIMRIYYVVNKVPFIKLFVLGHLSASGRWILLRSLDGECLSVLFIEWPSLRLPIHVFSDNC